MEERQKKVKKQIQERHKKVEKQRKNIAGMVTISIVVACMIISLLLQRKEINDSMKSYSARYEMLLESVEEEKEHVKEIEKLKEYMQTDEYIANIAREKLGMVKKMRLYFRREDDSASIRSPEPSLCESW